MKILIDLGIFLYSGKIVYLWYNYQYYKKLFMPFKNKNMQKALKQHIVFIENVLKEKNRDFDWQALSDFNRVQIGFFQHERMIHLLVTLFFGIMFFLAVIAQLLSTNAGLLIISIILLVMLGFYIWHYFVLENGVQKLYELDKKIAEHLKIGNALK